MVTGNMCLSCSAPLPDVVRSTGQGRHEFRPVYCFPCAERISENLTVVGVERLKRRAVSELPEVRDGRYARRFGW